MTGFPTLTRAAISSLAPSSSARFGRSMLSVVVAAATTTTASACPATLCAWTLACEAPGAFAFGFAASRAAGASRFSSSWASAPPLSSSSSGSGSFVPSSMTLMPARWARSLMPCSGVTTSGDATWPEPPPEYGLPGPHVFIVSRALAAGPRTASVLMRVWSSGSTPSFFSSTTPPAAASSASFRCSAVLTLDLRASSQGSAQPGFSSNRRW
mmetsp:Transcript_9607/g.30519  ORF Transcript_9607/g.30519 Transcript_9607/m.30519 type:complete len:212 (-) Transcript_9607:849-1484(-)